MAIPIHVRPKCRPHWWPHEQPRPKAEGWNALVASFHVFHVVVELGLHHEWLEWLEAIDDAVTRRLKAKAQSFLGHVGVKLHVELSRVNCSMVRGWRSSGVKGIGSLHHQRSLRILTQWSTYVKFTMGNHHQLSIISGMFCTVLLRLVPQNRAQ